LYNFGTYFVVNGATQSGTMAFTVQVVSPQPGFPPGLGALNAAISNQANFMFQTQFSSLTAASPCTPGAAGEWGTPGSCACAWAVNKLLTAIGLQPIAGGSGWVPNLLADLLSGRGVLIPFTQAMPGDIAIEASQSHIGICITPNCTVVYSNSSRFQNFTASTGPNMYDSTAPYIFRLVR
jgi:hypothetical protein